MRCPNCNEEIAEGFLYCQKCGYEIQIVPDYDSIVDEVLSDSLADVFKEVKTEEKKVSDGRPQDVTPKTPAKKRISKRKIILLLLLLLAIGGLVLGFFFMGVRSNSYEYQYEQAVAMVERQEYDKAQEYLDRAMQLNPGQLNMWKLQARIGENTGNTDKVKESYEYILHNLDPSNQEIYIKLVNLYISEGDMAKVKEMLAECKVASVLSYFKDYMAQVPTASFPEGIYYDSLTIELDAGGNDIYFTVDGSKPTTDSVKYEGAILLAEGTTTLRAISVTKEGVLSDEAIFNYEVSYLEPEVPEVSPMSGTYPQELEIVVQVPDGCTVLYTLDGTLPTLDSEVYTTPVVVNTSVEFTAVSVSLSGHMSDSVRRSYIIE